MKERFEGEEGKPRLIDLLKEQTIIGGDEALAIEIAEVGDLLELFENGKLIEQDKMDNDVYLILAGSFNIVVNERQVATRRAGTHIGEMAAIQPSQRRSASAIAAEQSVVLHLTEPQLTSLGTKYPQVWRRIAKELARRLQQRNALLSTPHDRVRIFIMSSAESLPIANAIQNGLDHDYLVSVWTNDVFRASQYNLEALEEAVDEADFAIAIAAGDDETTSREETWPVPRDNVVFELGFFMGRLGRQRSLLVEPRGEGVKLPSDLKGITTLTFKRPDKPKDMAAALGPVCNRIRDIANDLGPSN